MNPVRVLVNAESHITRVPESFYAGNTGVVLAHSDGMTHPYSFSISLASGKAENLLDPDGTFRIKDIEHVSIRDIVNQIAGSSYAGADTISHENRLAKLLELLSQLETSEVTIGELNGPLDRGGNLQYEVLGLQAASCRALTKARADSPPSPDSHQRPGAPAPASFAGARPRIIRLRRDKRRRGTDSSI